MDFWGIGKRKCPLLLNLLAGHGKRQRIFVCINFSYVLIQLKTTIDKNRHQMKETGAFNLAKLIKNQ